jgi:DNA-3-methyladenine glycosylase
VTYPWTKLPAARVADVAKTLLGWTVAAHGVTVRLTEVEAYGGVGEDPPAHSYRGMTKRNAVMWGPAGFAYVYFTYGMHWCLNVTAGRIGEPSAVLLRAGEVVAGLDEARARRGSASDRDLARGPARLASALALDKSADGTPLLTGDGPVLLSPPETPADQALIRQGPRVGVSTGIDTEWRFWLDGEPTVSAYRRGTRRRRR